MRSFLARPYHYFISYSHKDAAFAGDLKKWLAETAGLRVWFDQLDLGSGDAVQSDIATSVGQCQGIIFLLSKNSLASSFVRDEIDQALAEKKAHPYFQIVLLRLDDCDIGNQLKVVRQMKWHDLATSPTGVQLHLHAATEILCRVHAYDGWQRRQSELREVYISRGWREAEEEAFADAVCRRLTVHGLRLVGDLPDQGKADPHRIASIMRGCWGHAMILPRRNSPAGPEAAYKYFKQERDLSSDLGLPRVVVAQPNCELPAGLVEEAVVVDVETGQACAEADSVKSCVYEFVESLSKPSSEVHAFFASEYRGNEERNQLARRVVETVGTLPCYWGKDYRDLNIQGCIKEAITSARFLVADLTSIVKSADGAASASRVNQNACIEASIAWGGNVRILFLAAANPHNAEFPTEGKTKHIPFMLRNAQIDLYDDSVKSLAPGVAFLGAVHKAVLEDRKRFGRRVIDYELGA